MGTNYYVKDETEPKPPCECCGRPFDDDRDDPLHIGKSSSGWKFLFAPYPDLGLTSWAEWKVFLADKTIVDEYGTETSLQELADLVEAKQSGGICAETASSSQWGPFSRSENKDGEGYRFSTTADFS